jgi:ceramide glucosyltransferase
MTVNEFIQIILIALIAAGSLYGLASAAAVLDFFRSARIKDEFRSVPVSILKPLKGSDPELLENIRTFCDQNYPEFEVLLGLNRPDNDEQSAAKNVAVQMSGHNIRLISSSHDLGANQKVSNLQGMLEYAGNSLVAISDSDMRVGKDYLKTIAGEYGSSDNIGLVTCLYKISEPQSLGAALESLSIALDFIPSVLIARRLEGITFGLGASMLLSKRSIEDIGGMAAVSDYLADDYQIGNRIWNKGHKIVLSRYVMENIAGPMSFSEYFRHQIRWSKTIRISRPWGYLGSGITHIFPFAVLLLILMGPDLITLSLLGVVSVLRLTTGVVVQRKIIKCKAWLKWLILIPAKDLLSFIIWIGGFVGSKVTWRGTSYRIVGGGRIRKTGPDC